MLPNNYRGITIASCLGKLFTKMINNRFTTFLVENKIIIENQIGFSPGKRTADHTLVLKTLFDQAKCKRSPLYMCFIDLKSAFDTVWRDGLIYKLIKINVSNKFVNLIKNMYLNVHSNIKTKDGYTDSFPVNVGTRQGCSLSPSLFNCYINDIPKILDKISANQPLLKDIKISCLMYADDLVLISRTQSGLQKLISATESFCNKWQLTINVDKTKILIIHKRTPLPYKWLVYRKEIEIVQSFCYLGFELNSQGTFNKCIERLSNKAHQAYMSIREQFNFHDGATVQVLIKLFDSMIKPVALYGCELWGIYGWKRNHIKSIENYILSKDNTFEKLHTKFCKQALGLDRQTPDILAKAELGRYPIMGDIIKQSFRYWQHIISSDVSSLVYKALQVNIDMDRSGIPSYYTRIKSLLAVLQAKSKIYPIDKKNIKSQSSELCKNYRSMYEHSFFQLLKDKNDNNGSKGKFDIYCKTKRHYKMEKYLKQIRNNKLRRNITGIRCASNILPINILRKNNVKREFRYCNLCNNNQIGSELHVFMLCDNSELIEYRSKLFQLLYDLSPQLEILPVECQLQYILQAVEEKITLSFSIFVDKVYKLIKNVGKTKQSK
jgi:hypothetical protein